MFTFVVDEDIKFFRLIQFIKELKKNETSYFVKETKKDCVLSTRRKLKKCEMTSFDL